MGYQHIKFDAEGLKFEGVLSLRENSNSGHGAVLCHPHPLRGGNMDNHVITGLSVALDQDEISNLRFNFRGVGNSEGEYSEGELEHLEIIGAQDLLLNNNEIHITSIFTLGYSFGSRVILGHIEVMTSTSKLVLISPQTEAVKQSYLHELEIPVLIISGSKDHICDIDGLLDFAKTESGHIHIEKIEGADHFWIGYEEQLTDTIRRFLHE